MRVIPAVCVLAILAFVAGCGSSRMTPVASPEFSPKPGTFATAQKVTISDATSGATIYYTTDGSSPSTNSAKYTGPINVSTSASIEAIATAPAFAESLPTTGTYTIAPLVINATSFDFGDDLVGTTLTRTVATVTNSGPNAAPIALSTSGDSSYTIDAAQSCAATLPASNTCRIVINYTPTIAGVQTGTVSAVLTGSSSAPSNVTLSGTAAAVASGVVTTTGNPQVAQYAITAPFGASVTVQFGPDASYGLVTSAQNTAPDGGPVSLLVAGMKATSVYHMRAVVLFSNGLTFTDADHTFTTGALPVGIVPPLTVTTTPGLIPQPGIELIDTVGGGTPSAAIATDLSGNVIWTYPFPDRQPPSLLYPIKLMPNGNLIMEIGPGSSSVLNSPAPSGSLIELREIDLAGNIVQRLSIQDLNARLAAAGFTDLTLQLYSHDVTILPDGHILVITNTIKPFSDLPGLPGTTNVLGDVIVDLDKDMNPVWVWNEFDHFDVTRHPYDFPDWTHSNAITYSKDDGNFLVSIRHQNWVVKVNYNNGLGDGKVLWKLGYQGDFKLLGGTDPTDWFYSQHNPAFFSSNTTGLFSLGLMDNGDDRAFPDGTDCATQGGAECFTTIPALQVDENAMTSTLTFRQVLPTNLYSQFAGDVLLLDNHNIEYNLAGVGADSEIFEVTQTPTPETVWHMHIAGTNTYRAFRMPSLYPGVQW